MSKLRKPFPFRPYTLELFGDKRPSYTLSGEIAAGLTVSLIALPLALALGVASIPMGMETPYPAPALGIITAIIGGFLISAFGGCRVQIGGPTAAFVPIIILVVIEHGYSGLLLATMMAGAILMFMGLFRMGTLIKYIPWPVTSGFTTGIAVAIMITQIPDAFGLRPERARPHEFLANMKWLADHATTFSPYALAICMASLLIILLWPRLKIRLVPGTVVALLGVTLLVSLLGWGAGQGVETIGSRFGAEALPKGLPFPVLPSFEWSRVRDLIGPATAIALLGAIESLLSAVVADGLTGGRHDSNSELVAQGLANVICPFFAGLPVTGAIARTSANVASGGRTPIAGMAAAVFLLIVILVAAPLATKIPLSAIAAVLIAVALRMGEWHELGRAGKMPPSDALVLITTFGLTVIFDLVIAVEVGMVLAAILFIKRVSETTEVSRVSSNDMLIRAENIAQGKTIPENVLIYRIFGPFLFGAAEKMEDALARIDRLPKVLILELHLVTAMDATGLNVLESIVERMQQGGNHVILSGIHHQPLRMLRKAGFIEIIGRLNFCATLDDSLKRAGLLLDDGNPVNKSS